MRIRDCSSDVCSSDLDRRHGLYPFTNRRIGMTPGRLDGIWRYPVKGLPGQRLESVTVAAGRPLPHDRVYAVAQGDADFGGERPGWIRRSNFLQVANNAPLVTLGSSEERRVGKEWVSTCRSRWS